MRRRVIDLLRVWRARAILAEGPPPESPTRTLDYLCEMEATDAEAEGKRHAGGDPDEPGGSGAR